MLPKSFEAAHTAAGLAAISTFSVTETAAEKLLVDKNVSSKAGSKRNVVGHACVLKCFYRLFLNASVLATVMLAYLCADSKSWRV